MRWYHPDLFSRGTSPETRRKPEIDRRSHGSSRTVIEPRDLLSWQPTALFTYYAFVTLMVIFLTVSLMWVPFLQLVAESNAVISKVLLYINRVLLGGSDICILNQLGYFFISQHGQRIISFCCLFYFLHLLSADLLILTGHYIYNLPNHKYLHHLKEWALSAIEFLLSLTGKDESIIENDSEDNYNAQTDCLNQLLC